MITEEMWKENLTEVGTLIQRKERRDNLQQTRFVGQAMSEIKSDPRWKSYADHIMGLKEEAQDRSRAAGDLALETTGDATEHQYAYLKFKERAFTYNHVLQLIEALIERGETATEQLKEIEHGIT